MTDDAALARALLEDAERDRALVAEWDATLPEFEHLDDEAPADAEPVEPELPSPPNDEAIP